MNWTGEPKLADALRDPVVQALMEADGIDAEALGAVLSGAARRVKLRLMRRIPAKQDRGSDSRRPI
jgi:hypothetical protein